MDLPLADAKGYVDHSGSWFQLPGPNSCWTNYPEMCMAASYIAGGVYDRLIVCS